jgi:hypothetical protein
MAAADPKVRAIHLEMAARYALMAGPAPGAMPPPEMEAQTA